MVKKNKIEEAQVEIDSGINEQIYMDTKRREHAAAMAKIEAKKSELRSKTYTPTRLDDPWFNTFRPATREPVAYEEIDMNSPSSKIMGAPLSIPKGEQFPNPEQDTDPVQSPGQTAVKVGSWFISLFTIFGVKFYTYEREAMYQVVGAFIRAWPWMNKK